MDIFTSVTRFETRKVETEGTGVSGLGERLEGTGRSTENTRRLT